MKINITNNAISTMIQTCEELFPEIGDVSVAFMSSEQAGASGYSEKSESGWHMGLNQENPYGMLPEIIAAEVAHIVDATRNPENEENMYSEQWTEIFEQINAEFEKRMEG